MRSRATFVAATGCIGLASCLHAVVREAPGLRVEATDVASAERRLELAHQIRGRILADLFPLAPNSPGRSGDARSIRIVEFTGSDRWHELVLGTADDRQRLIRLRSSATDLDLVLAHELAHLLLGTDWSVLPAALEEGLADHLGARALGQVPRFRAERGEGLMGVFGGLRLNLSWRLPGANAAPLSASTVLDWRAPDERVVGDPPGTAELLEASEDSFRPQAVDSLWSPVYYGVGFVLIERILMHAGLAGLRCACADAFDAGSRQVPLTRVFELAGLPAGTTDPSLGTIASWLRDSWDAPTQRAWLSWRAASLAPALAKAMGWDERVSAPETAKERYAALQRWQVRISVTWEDLPTEAAPLMSLSDVPTLFAQVAAQP